VPHCPIFPMIFVTICNSNDTYRRDGAGLRKLASIPLSWRVLTRQLACSSAASAAQRPVTLRYIAVAISSSPLVSALIAADTSAAD
jgi:hypothetical protein